MHVFFTSIIIVVLAELGDKTQLLALVLAARFQKPWPIILGIICATLVNHTFAGLVGIWLSYLLSPESLRWIVALLFLAMAIWILIPDKLEEEGLNIRNNLGVFFATLVAFFLAEMGDKTQIATVALAAHYKHPFLVISGTTLGMLLADVPAVFVGTMFAQKLPMKWIHLGTAALFVIMSVVTLIY